MKKNSATSLSSYLKKKKELSKKKNGGALSERNTEAKTEEKAEQVVIVLDDDDSNQPVDQCQPSAPQIRIAEVSEQSFFSVYHANLTSAVLSLAKSQDKNASPQLFDGKGQLCTDARNTNFCKLPAPGEHSSQSS